MRAYLELVRVPNVFTAMADILLGFLFTHQGLDPAVSFVLLLAASSLLYMSGMVFNDYFDRVKDARERPTPDSLRPCRRRHGMRVGIVMMTLGIAAAWVASSSTGNPWPAIISMLLAGAVVTYDGLIKDTPFAPLAMGACRTLNVLLGMSLATGQWHAVHYAVAGGVGIYVVGVTLFARGEARVSSRPQLVLGLATLWAGIGVLSSTPEWSTGMESPPVSMPERWYVFWGLIALLVGWRCARAVVTPTPQHVQAAVRNCIFALVILDAGAVLAVQDRLWGLAIVALLLPTILLGRWIYST